jgi:hypothetical protein
MISLKQQQPLFNVPPLPTIFDYVCTAEYRFLTNIDGLDEDIDEMYGALLTEIYTRGCH